MVIVQTAISITPGTSGYTRSQAITLGSAPTVGNLLILGTEVQPSGGGNPSVPSGWTCISGTQVWDSGAMYRIVQAGDGTTWTFTIPDNQSYIGAVLGMWEITLPDPANPLDWDNNVYGYTGNGLSSTSPWPNFINSTPVVLGQIPLVMAVFLEAGQAGGTFTLTTGGWTTDAHADTAVGIWTNHAVMAHGPAASALTATSLGFAATLSPAMDNIHAWTMLMNVVGAVVPPANPLAPPPGIFIPPAPKMIVTGPPIGWGPTSVGRGRAR